MAIDIKFAENNWKFGVEMINDTENPTVEETEKIQSIRIELDSLKQQYNVTSARLKQLEADESDKRERLLGRHKFNPTIAREVIRLFPVDRYYPMVEHSFNESEVKDVLGFLRLLAVHAEESSKKKKDAVDADEVSPSATAAAVVASTSDSASKPSSSVSAVANRKTPRLRSDDYTKFCKSSSLRAFVEYITVPSSQFGDALRHGYKAEPKPTPEMSCEMMAQQLLNDISYFKTEQHVLHAAQVIIANEMSLEPTVRSMVRDVLKRTATISTFPTDKGTAEITPFSKYFGLHYLEKKPLQHFFLGEDRSLFIRLVEAERQGLIIVSIDPPQKRDHTGCDVVDLEPFLAGDLNLLQQFLPSIPRDVDPHPIYRASWDLMRLITLQLCIENYLLPSLKQEFRRDLIRIGKEKIIEEAADNFSKLLAIGPFVPDYNDPRERVKDLLLSCPYRPYYASVVSIFISTGGDEPLCMCYVNKDGVLRAHDYLPSKVMNQKAERIKKFILENKPDLIVLNSSGGAATRSTCVLIEKDIIKQVEEKLKAQHDDSMNRNYMNYNDDNNNNRDDDFTPYSANVIIINDDLACIFKNSPRSKRMFPDLQPSECAAVSLARYTQEPLAEYCSAWMNANAQDIFGFELLFLKVHPLQVNHSLMVIIIIIAINITILLNHFLHFSVFSIYYKEYSTHY